MIHTSNSNRNLACFARRDSNTDSHESFDDHDQSPRHELIERIYQPVENFELYETQRLEREVDKIFARIPSEFLLKCETLREALSYEDPK